MTRFLVAGILLCGAALRLFGVAFGWPYVFHPDEAKSVTAAVGYLNFDAFDLNPHTFIYPSLYGYLLAGVVLLAGLVGKAAHLVPDAAAIPAAYQAAPVLFHVLGRMLTAAFGVATIAVAYRTGRQLGGAAAGAAAALALSLNFWHLRESQFAAVDVPTTFFTTLAFLPACAIIAAGRRRDYVATGLAVGLAAATKYPGGLAAVFLVVAHVFRWRSDGGSGRRAWLAPNLWLGMSAAALGFVAGCPYCALDAPTMVDHLVREGSHANFGQTGLRAFLAYGLDFPPAFGLGAPALALAFGGVAYSAWSRSQAHLLFLSFPLLYYVIIGNAPAKIERYILPVVPFLCIAAGLACAVVAQRLVPPRWTVFAACGGVALAMAPVAALDLRYVRALAAADTRVAARAWITGHIPAGARLALPGGDSWWTNPPLQGLDYEIVPISLLDTVMQQEFLQREERLRQRVGLEPPALLPVPGVGVAPEARPDGSAAAGPPAPPQVTAAEDLDVLGVQYLIVNDYFWQAFSSAPLASTPAGAGWRRFLEAPPDRVRLVQEFRPEISGISSSFALGPRIRIYQLDALTLSLDAHPTAHGALVRVSIALAGERLPDLVLGVDIYSVEEPAREHYGWWALPLNDGRRTAEFHLDLAQRNGGFATPSGEPLPHGFETWPAGDHVYEARIGISRGASPVSWRLFRFELKGAAVAAVQLDDLHRVISLVPLGSTQ